MWRVYPQEIGGMTSSTRIAGALQRIEAAARDRAAHYRDYAAHFRKLAAAEPVGYLRAQLLHLARQYDLLAATCKPAAPLENARHSSQPSSPSSDRSFTIEQASASSHSRLRG